MKKVHKKCIKYVAIAWGSCFFVFILAFIFVLAPQKAARLSLASKLSTVKDEYESAQMAKSLKNQKALAEKISELRNKLDSFVTGFESSHNLTFDISQIANEKAVESFTIKSRDNQRLMEIPNCKKLAQNSIDIAFLSSFNQFASMLNSLERNKPVVFIDQFKIVRSDKDNYSHQVTMNLSVLVRKPQQG
jgi:Tfp pilus assembly protein PilO